MKQDDLATRVRAGEYFHSLKMWPNAWAVLRCDGRSFSKLTAKNF